VSKGVKNTIAILSAGVIVLILAGLVWGQTIQMEQANRLLLANRTAEALAKYQGLAAHTPDSPYLLHNLGLCFYRQGKMDTAAGYFRKGLAQSSRLTHSEQPKVQHSLEYHLGNSLFKQAQLDQNPGGQKINLYQEALNHYQKAIEADRQDLDAKYNYELTKLRIEKAQQEQSDRSENNNQQDKQSQPDSQKNSQNNRGQNNSKEKDGQGKSTQSKQQGKDPQQNKNKGQNDSKKSQSGTNQPQRPDQTNNSSSERRSGSKQQNYMSKAEAEALLKAAENGDEYQGPLINGEPATGDKDW
jgi:Ca-activated chloride channel family protein